MKRLIALSLSLLLPLQSLMADVGAPQNEQSLTQMIILFVVIGGAFYFLLMRPEQKRRKELDMMRAQLSKGDRVHIMGIIGTIYKIHDDLVVIKTVDGSKFEALRTAITEVIPGGGKEELQ